jgi:FkbM family methyltransferase
MADCVGPRGKVLAFEPLPEMAAALKSESALRYGDENPIKVFQAAVSSVEGRATFHRSPLPSRSALTPGAESFTGKTVPFEVPVVTLDSLVKDGTPQWVSVLKIDAEGEEYNILNGGQSFFLNCAPMTVIEFTPGQLESLSVSIDDFFNLLDRINYSFYNIDGTAFDRDFVNSGKYSACYERLGARRGHWVEAFLKDKMPDIVKRQLMRRLAIETAPLAEGGSGSN